MHTLEYVCILLHSSMHTTLEYVVYYAYYPLVVHMHVCMYVCMYIMGTTYAYKRELEVKLVVDSTSTSLIRD